MLLLLTVGISVSREEAVYSDQILVGDCPQLETSASTIGSALRARRK
jgi:hypothetical protein